MLPPAYINVGQRKERLENIRIREFRAVQIGQWLACGFRFWRRRPWGNTAPFALLALVILIVRAIPIIGDVVLLLLLPSVIASALIHTQLAGHAAPAPEPATRGRRRKPSLRERLEGAWKEIQPVLFGAWSKQENIFPLLIVGFVLVALGLVAHVLVNAVGGQALVSSYGFAEMTLAQQVRLLLSYGAGIVFWLLVGMTVLWALPLFAIRDLTLVSAQALGLRALMRNLGIVAVLLLLVAVPLLPGMVLRLQSPWLGTVVLWLGLTVATILLNFSGYCSFRLVFAEDSAPRVPATSPAPQPVVRRS